MDINKYLLYKIKTLLYSISKYTEGCLYKIQNDVHKRDMRWGDMRCK